MKLEIIKQDFSVCKVPDYAKTDLSQPYCFIAKTEKENSLVCLSDHVPEHVIARDDGWRAFRVQGTLDFSLIGVLAQIAGILAEHGISLFAISTYDTDYILTKKQDFPRAIQALSENGYQII